MSSLNDYGISSLYGASWAFFICNSWPSPIKRKLLDAFVVCIVLLIIETSVYSSQSFAYVGTVMGMVVSGLVSGSIGSFILISFSEEGGVPKSHKLDENHDELTKTIPSNVRSLPSHLDNHIEAESIFGGTAISFGEVMLIVMSSLVIISWDTNHLYGEVTAIFPLLVAEFIVGIGSLIMIFPTSINFTLSCIANTIGILILVSVNSVEASSIMMITVLVSAPLYWIECGLYVLWIKSNDNEIYKLK